MTGPTNPCAKCGHLPYNHEDSGGDLMRCRYWGCRCRYFRLTLGKRRQAQADPPHILPHENAALDSKPPGETG